MSNERLRDALRRNGLTPDYAASALSVDPKTVERWITQDRVPYPKHQSAISAMVQEPVSYLWPNATSPRKAMEASESEVVKIYPHRHNVPGDLWHHLLREASSDITILVYVGMFLTEEPGLIKTLRDKAQAGARIRLLFGDPKSRVVIRRSEDEGIGKGAIPAKIKNVLAIFRPLEGEKGVEIRCHGTTLYNSIFRYDDEMIVNTHIFGMTAPYAPALHLRRLAAGDLFETYLESYEAVWKDSKPPAW